MQLQNKNGTAHPTWYVRQPSGEQFGPVSGEQIFLWVREGRIDVSALVWREGWPQWRVAGECFAPPAPTAPVATPPVAGDEEIAITPAPVRSRPKKRRSDQDLLTLVLSLALVALVPAVLWVALSSQNPPDAQSVTQGRPAATEHGQLDR